MLASGTMMFAWHRVTKKRHAKDRIEFLIWYPSQQSASTCYLPQEAGEFKQKIAVLVIHRSFFNS
jgi:hypothetical protein